MFFLIFDVRWRLFRVFAYIDTRGRPVYPHSVGTMSFVFNLKDLLSNSEFDVSCTIDRCTRRYHDKFMGFSNFVLLI